MLLTKTPKHLLWGFGKRKNKYINADIGIFLLFNASQGSFPYGKLFRRKAGLLLQSELKIAIYLCSLFIQIQVTMNDESNVRHDT